MLRMMADHPLNPSQKNYLQASLYHFEQAMRQSLALIHHKNVSGYLSEQQCDISTSKKKKIASAIRKATLQIKRLVNLLELERETEKASRQIIGLMSTSWVNLAGVNANHLKAYGKIDDKTAQSIEAAFAGLAQIARDIQNLLESSSEADE